MPNANYRSGARLERLARAQLERNGFTVVRSAGSKGPVDLVAWDGVCVRLIQVKSEGGATKATLARLKALQRPPGTWVELWERNPLNGAGWNFTKC